MTLLVQTQDTATSGTDELQVTIDTAGGNTMVATITVWMTGNTPVALESVQDSADNAWLFSPALQAAGSFSPSNGLWGYTAVACSIGAAPVTEVTMTFSALISSFGEANIQEFTALPAGAQMLAAAADGTLAVAVNAYDTPTLAGLPAGCLAVCSTSFLGEFTGVSPAGWTIINSVDTIAAYNLAAAAGSVGAALTATVAGDVPSSAILAIGARPPAAAPMSSLADAIRPGRLFPAVGRG